MSRPARAGGSTLQQCAARPSAACRTVSLQLRPIALVLLLCGAVLPRAQAAPHPAEVLVEQATRALRSHPDEGRQLAEKALAALARQPDADLEIRARLLLCDHASERDSELAQRQIEAIDAALPRASRPGLRAGALGCRGEMLESAGDNTQAMAYYEQAVGVAEGARDVEMLANSLFQRGYLRGVLGNYATGLADLQRARTEYEKLGLAQQALTTLNGIAILYNRMGDYAQARSYYEQTLKAQEASGALREVVVTVHNLGRAHEKLGDWPAARQAFEKALAASREIAYPRGQAHALRGLASVRNAAGDAAGALDLLQQAEALVGGEMPEARLKAQILLERGKALQGLRRYAESIQALEEARAVFARADSLAELAATHDELAQAHAESGDWKTAYAHQVDFKVASDKLLHQQLDQRFATLKVEFDTAAKERQNIALMRENLANEQALEQQRRANQLQVLAISLGSVLALLLAAWAVQQRRTSLRMRALALTDELTGLANRRNVLARLSQLLSAPGARPCAVLIGDIDHFKPINDRYGHPVGDAILREVAASLSAAVREPVCLGRLGGEEFLVVLPDTGLEAAAQVAERLREGIATIDTSRWFNDRALTMSLGVTVSTPGTDTLSTMLKRADEGLYEAKHAGRNRVVARTA
jgi:diguanylate cyclase (GGDEF)-like protein